MATPVTPKRCIIVSSQFAGQVTVDFDTNHLIQSILETHNCTETFKLQRPKRYVCLPSLDTSPI